MRKKAVILVSGGLDSATCLAIAQSLGFECYALSFQYGQKHVAEINAAIKITQVLHAKHEIFSLSTNIFQGSALTDKNIDVPNHQNNKKIPTTYVPARNTIFFSIALAFAEVIEANDIFTGICAVDYSGYSDARPEYLESFQQMANLATKTAVEGTPIIFHAPLLYLSKAETIKQGIALGLDYGMTVSCYRANDNGEACRTCGSCVLRAKGFREAGVDDPTLYIS